MWRAGLVDQGIRSRHRRENLARLDPAARGQVLQTDLSEIGVTELGSYPDLFRGAPAVPELFFNDQRMTLARWPNEGWATIAKIVDSGTTHLSANEPPRPGTFEYSGDRPARWKVESGVWLLGYWCYDWYEEAIKVQAVDRDKRQITLARPAVYGIKQGNPAPRRYRALNVLEELDQPGEYYLDRAAGRLYLWPPSTMAEAHIVLSTLNAPLVSLQDASYLTLRGFIVEAGLADGLVVTGGRGNRIEACIVRNTRQVGIRVSGGTGHRVEGCDIHDTGTGGLVLEGGDRKTLAPASHEAVNNHIWRFSQHQLSYASGIMLSGVGNRAAHNLLHDAPHMAVGIGGNDHVFEYNVVHDVCNASDDAGALYKGRNPSCRGNVIRYNLWRDIGSPMGHGTAAVYFDDGDGGDTVFGNIFCPLRLSGQRQLWDCLQPWRPRQHRREQHFHRLPARVGFRAVGRPALERNHRRRTRLLLAEAAAAGRGHHPAALHHAVSGPGRLHKSAARPAACQSREEQRAGALRTGQ